MDRRLPAYETAEGHKSAEASCSPVQLSLSSSGPPTRGSDCSADTPLFCTHADRLDLTERGEGFCPLLHIPNHCMSPHWGNEDSTAGDPGSSSASSASSSSASAAFPAVAELGQSSHSSPHLISPKGAGVNIREDDSHRSAGADGEDGFYAKAKTFGSVEGLITHRAATKGRLTTWADEEDAKSQATSLYMDGQTTPEPYYKVVCREITENGFVTFFMTLLTLFALFGKDIWAAAADAEHDDEFNILTMLCLVLFTVEMVLMSIGQQDYLFGFFFCLDAVSTASLILDLTWISDALQSGESVESASAARTGRTARAGSRAGRVVRLFRLIRIVKLYKGGGRTAPGEELDMEVGEPEYPKPEQADEEEEEVGGFWDSEYPASVSFGLTTLDQLYAVKESYPGSTAQEAEFAWEAGVLSYISYHRVTERPHQPKIRQPRVVHIILPEALSLIDPIPEELSLSVKNMTEKIEMWDLNVGREVLERLQQPAIVTDEGVILDPDVESLSELRKSEQERLKGECHTVTFDRRPFTRFEANLSIAQTCFICLVLSVGAMMFSYDANELVLKPLEKMVKRVEIIRKNPLEAIRLEEELLQREVDLLRKKSQEENDYIKETRRLLDYLLSCCGLRNKEGVEPPMETIILEKTLVKIGTLMALGFGEAGTFIIAKNLESTEGVNPMVPGRKVTCIFGFCDIRNFTDATEILREKVMVFVNQIAEIVHGVCDDFSGSANKNIGDAFLLVWKLPERHPYTGKEVAYRIQDDGETKEITDTEIITKTADMALMSYLKIIANINKSPVIAEYRRHEGLLARLGKHYRVRMGFGLHQGWAIEGAIGTTYKIDASYLSPNVNLASRLEAATKQFGVPILVSGGMIELLSKRFQDECRRIDRVTVKGSKQPIDLWTVDLHPEALAVDGPKRPKDHDAKNPKAAQAYNAYKKLRAGKRKAALKRRLWNPEFEVASLFESDSDLKKMRAHLPPGFLDRFSEGWLAYHRGDWADAKDILTSIKDSVGATEDGPCTVLLNYMGERSFVAPDDWQGYRELTEK
ncbi:unnamed protein product [Vitrella brassicaformis CCMP3155]|uniref:Guanylate cyclase domain-containing protein n=2 Tax=Vitrella brassicaformis TaxID=1169539 RepID=A0A0G4EWQ6_VITBC|nr:unnamed protein product [Vitrella brassicaformis CCMP3155]|eukprot:CEM03412.1 unnamed protein product [Vitrella brassicaformis CCMP3155]